MRDWPKYETEVVEGHTGPPATTSPQTWDDLVPDGDIGALAKTIQHTALGHTFDDSYEPAIVNAILAYHSWTTFATRGVPTLHGRRETPWWPTMTWWQHNLCRRGGPVRFKAGDKLKSGPEVKRLAT